MGRGFDSRPEASSGSSVAEQRTTPSPLVPRPNTSGKPGLETIAMGSRLNVKNGTPVGNAHLCRNCTNGQFTTGYRDSDVLVICTNSSPARVVPFPVHECTEFWDRNRPDYEQMDKLAINMGHNPHRKPTPGFRGVGFASVHGVDEDELEDELEEVARS